MRPSQKSNRNRGKNNRPKGLGNVVNRVFESAGPEGKVRGTPQQIIDKYEQLARDAQTAGDRVTAENFLQHAEHYLRLLSAAQAEQQAHQQQNQPSGQQPHMNGHARRDDDEGRQPQPSGEQPEAAPAESRAESRSESRRDDAPRAEGGKPEGAGKRSRKSDAAKEAEASAGMETIESDGPDDGSSLVATPEAPEEAPRPRARRRRTRRDKPADGEAQASDEPKGDADAAAVSG
ncbi:DUF4167 domain-containing protein [Albimonas pacifica]|nr:DUF4167 domain-containing protein [Albimonas pacifica]